jgi:hypothetical protein
VQKDEIDIDELRQERIARKEEQKELAALRLTLERMSAQRHYVIHDAGESNTIRFALTGDRHIGSLYERSDAVAGFYDLARREKIPTVLDAGDVLDGAGIYKGQEYEQYAIGMDRQFAALAERTPRVDGITTHFITGNHDYSFYKAVGADPGPRIAEITGWKYAGRDQAWIELHNAAGKSVSVMLIHPDGGTAYAYSYRPQKIVESLAGGKKPDIMGIGHFHKSEWIPEHRNVSVFQVGAFQSQTPFMARKGSPAHVGGWIVEVTPGRENLTCRVRAEFVAFYEPEKRKC